MLVTKKINYAEGLDTPEVTSVSADYLCSSLQSKLINLCSKKRKWSGSGGTGNEGEGLVNPSLDPGSTYSPP